MILSLVSYGVFSAIPMLVGMIAMMVAVAILVSEIPMRRSQRVAAFALVLMLAMALTVEAADLIRPNLDCDALPWWLRWIEPAC